MGDIQAMAETIVERFQPEEIILFGSHADGKPGPDSDVDLLVVMPFHGRAVDAAARIRASVHTPFSIDVLVRDPQVLRKRIGMGDSFLRNILDNGKVLHGSHRG